MFVFLTQEDKGGIEYSIPDFCCTSQVWQSLGVSDKLGDPHVEEALYRNIDTSFVAQIICQEHNSLLNSCL